MPVCLALVACDEVPHDRVVERLTCVDGAAQWVDEQGSPLRLVERCGACGCAAGRCVAECCGDDVLQPERGEICDGADLGGGAGGAPRPNCQTMGFYYGQLACTSDCGLIDTTGCSGTCGDGILDGYPEVEVCDGLDAAHPVIDASESCRAHGYYAGEPHCNTGCGSLEWEGFCEGRCGDGAVDSTYGEQCDGESIPVGVDCSDRPGLHPGVPGCLDCRLDFSSCPRCGDGTLDEGFEECDGDVGDSAACPAGTRGEVTCGDNCALVYDCAGFCGNGRVDADQGEECDGEDLGGATCTEGTRGELACSEDCQLILDGCAPYCGNGRIDAELGEECDGQQLGDVTCQSLGHELGEVQCTQQCALDLSSCHDRCGDGICEEPLENSVICPDDCFCGNNRCETDEDCRCLSDCGCEGFETCNDDGECACPFDGPIVVAHNLECSEIEVGVNCDICVIGQTCHGSIEPNHYKVFHPPAGYIDLSDLSSSNGMCSHICLELVSCTIIYWKPGNSRCYAEMRPDYVYETILGVDLDGSEDEDGWVQAREVQCR